MLLRSVKVCVQTLQTPRGSVPLIHRWLVELSKVVDYASVPTLILSARSRVLLASNRPHFTRLGDRSLVCRAFDLMIAIIRHLTCFCQ